MNKAILTTRETRCFTMHPKLLLDVVSRQAGTLSKAILEAVMNSIDAGATRCDITLKAGRVTVVDDGKGFRSRDEIEQFFEVFGQPHEASEGKRYGTFRMGRGQCFSFGRNLWRTGTFKMDVDIKERGLEYELLTHETAQPGCHIDIELYETLRPTAVIDMTRDFERLVRYAPIPVVLNGKALATPASSAKWPLETDEAFMKIDVGGVTGLKVYNLGIHVADLSSHTWGCSGTIVSKVQLKVNFARNDIMDDDPVWRKIAAVVRKQVDGGSGKKRLSGSERSVLLRRILSQELDWRDYRDTKFFTDCTGRGWSIRQLQRTRDAFGTEEYNGTGCYSFAPRNSFDGDRIMQHKLGFVMDEEMLDIAGVTEPAKFFEQVLPGYAAHLSSWDNGGILRHTYRPLATLAVALKNDSYVLVPAKAWTRREQMVLPNLDKFAYAIVHRLEGLGVETKKRRLVVGESESAEGWTDGEDYIALSRAVLARVRPNTAGFIEIAALLLHEHCHVSRDIGEHVHEPEFYRLYHDASRVIGDLAENAAYAYARQMRKEAVKLPVMLARAAALGAEAEALDVAIEVWSEHREAKRQQLLAECRTIAAQLPEPAGKPSR